MNFIPKIVYGSPEVEINFQYIPEGDFLPENFRTDQRTITTSLGVAQTQFNYNEVNYRVTHTFVTESIKDDYQTFYLNWASLGKSFKYYPSNDEAEFLTVTLSRFDFAPRRLFSVNVAGNFEYSFQMAFRQIA